MATAWIREYQTSGRTNWDRLPIPQEPGTDQTVTFTTTTQSAAFAQATKYIAFQCSAAAHYVVGANPTATTNALKVPADTPIHIGVVGGQKIAFIAAT